MKVLSSLWRKRLSWMLSGSE